MKNLLTSLFDYRVKRFTLVIASIVFIADIIHVSRQTIHAIETGKFTPSTLLALKMAHYFGCKVEDIFELEDSDLLQKSNL